jgi:hypothetical protein
MKKLRIASWIIFFTGILLEILHVTGFGILLITGTLLSLIYSVAFLINNFKNNLQDSILNLTMSSWILYLLFRFLYLPGGLNCYGFPLIFVLPVMISIAYVCLLVLGKVKLKFSHIFLTLVISFSVIISYIHSDRIFYFFNLNSILNSKSRNMDYKSWDKYSWFLYIANKQEEAIQANLNAQKSNSRCLKVPHYFDVNRDSVLINEHKKRILSKNWMDFP